MNSVLNKIFVILLGAIIYNCSSSTKNAPGKSIIAEDSKLNYAKGFKISNYGNYRKISVINPWQKSNGVNLEYYLVDNNVDIPSGLEGKQIVRTPVKRVICLSTSHVGFLSALNEISTLKGLSGTAFVSDSQAQKAVAAKEIVDIGYDQGINYELILKLKPDLIMAYGVGGDVTGFINKLQDLGLNVILNGEYLEETPLAKTEWIKFAGEFFNKAKEANEYFLNVEQNYISISQKVKAVKNRPVVLTGLPYKDAWWMAGGHSNLASLIRDAGAEFLWKDNLSREAFVVSLEEVVVRSSKADVWINCGTVNSVSELISTDTRFGSFPQVQKRAIFNNNLKVGPGGGNDYWEKGVVRPDLILSDLVKIFHPECDSTSGFNFYKKLPD